MTKREPENCLQFATHCGVPVSTIASSIMWHILFNSHYLIGFLHLLWKQWHQLRKFKMFHFSLLKFVECLWPLTCVALHILRTEIDLCNRRLTWLFNDAVRNFECTASNNGMDRLDGEWSCRDQNRCIPQAFTQKNWLKLRETWIRTGSLQANTFI